MNVVVMMGNLVRDPVLRTTETANNCCSFKIAVDRPIVKKGQEKKTDFFDVKVWSKQADSCAKYLKKGSKVVVNGSMENYSYTKKDGSIAYGSEIKAREVRFLDFGNVAQSDSDVQETAHYADNGYSQVTDEDLPF